VAHPTLELDFRVGGTKTNRGGPPDGRSTPTKRLQGHRAGGVHRVRVHDGRGGTLISLSVATVESAASARTMLTFTEQGVFLDGADTPAIRDKDTNHLLD
jgi:hypothetical protein